MSVLRVGVVGAGNMGAKWARLADASPATQVAAVVDIDGARARDVLASLEDPAPGARTAGEPGDVLAGLDLLVNTTIPAAHHDVSRAALEAGVDVVSEKPAAEDLADGLRLAAVAEHTGRTLSISQSRRHVPGVAALAAAVAGSGGAGTVRCTLAREARFGGFRELMAHPLLVDMAVHAFDAARRITGADAVAVTCEETDPHWSWFDGAADATATVTMGDGSLVVYSGSWCALGAETSWNGDWRVETADGSLLWDGEGAPRRHRGGTVEDLAAPAGGRQGIAAAFDEAVAAAQGGPVPDGVVEANLGTLAMVEAAVLSAEEGRRVTLAEVVGRSAGIAHRRERDAGVRGRLDAIAARCGGDGSGRTP